MSDSTPPNRRGDPRYLTCVLAGLKTESTEAVALIRDVSVSGAFLLTQKPFPAGERLDLNLHFSTDLAGAHHVTARVVRSGRRDRDRSDLWAFSAAVRFDEPLLHLEPEIREAARRAEGLAFE